MCFKISQYIENSQDILSIYLESFNDLESIIQVISIIYTDIILEIEDDYSQKNIKQIISAHFYNLWFTFVYSEFNIKLISNINSQINKIRSYLCSELSFNNLIDKIKINNLILEQEIDLDEINNLDSSIKIISIAKIEQFIYSTDILMNILLIKKLLIILNKVTIFQLKIYIFILVKNCKHINL